MTENEKIIHGYQLAKVEFDKAAQAAFEEPTVEQYMAAHAKAYRRFEPYKIAYKSIQEPLYDEIPTYGDHYTLEDFVNYCMDGGFIDYDGSGRYATATQITNIGIAPSDVTGDVYIKDKFTHVCWFNK